MTPFDITEPFPISLIGGRYLLFNVDIVTYLRRTHHICGMTVGTLPQAPQQNLFLGLPVELMAEEARLLVEKGVAYVLDDTAWHRHRFSTLEGEDREKYLASLRSQGLKVSQSVQAAKQKRTQQALAKHLSTRNSQNRQQSDSGNLLQNERGSTACVDDRASLFDKHASEATPCTEAFPITPTITATCGVSLIPRNPTQLPKIAVPPSYALYKHLHEREYFILPGLRFGCDYNVYPGDPLRFHSHFIAVGYEWEQQIPVFDIIGGGRLGTAVKKAFLLGGVDTASSARHEDEDKVRTFAIEWGGM